MTVNIPDSQRYKSSPDTLHKQASFRYVLGAHLNILREMCAKYAWMRDLWHFDLHAGIGRDPEYGDGSPVIFAKLADGMSMSFNARFFESDPDSYIALEQAMKPYGRANYLLVPRDHNIMVQRMPVMKSAYGQLYADPSDTQIPVELLRMANDRLPHVDFIISYAATSLKRVNGLLRNRGQEYEVLLEKLRKIGKRKWIIREPIGTHQWTMLIGTNYEPYPEYKSQGFYNVKSVAGQEILQALSYSKQELIERYQLPLMEGK